MALFTHTAGWRKRLLTVQTDPACRSRGDWELLSPRRVSIPAPDKRPKPRGGRALLTGSSSAPAFLHSSFPSSLPPSQPAPHSLHYKALEQGCGISTTSFIFLPVPFLHPTLLLCVNSRPKKTTKQKDRTGTWEQRKRAKTLMFGFF